MQVFMERKRDPPKKNQQTEQPKEKRLEIFLCRRDGIDRINIFNIE